MKIKLIQTLALCIRGDIPHPATPSNIKKKNLIKLNGTQFIYSKHQSIASTFNPKIGKKNSCECGTDK